MMSLESKFVMPRSMLCVAMIGLSVTPLSFAQDKAAVTRNQAPAPTPKDASSPAKPLHDDAEPGTEGGAGQRGGGDKGKAKGDGPEKKEKTAYDYELPGSDGKGVPLASFKGKTVLIVNLARNSSYNSQLAGLQKLSEQYKDKGLVVIGVPSNDFGAAEPGTDAEVQKAYTVDAKVTFPVMAKCPLTGEMELPFYLFLTTGKSAPEAAPVHWNYTKFILDKAGKVAARLNPEVAPDSSEMLSTLDQILDGTYKPKKAGGEGGGPGSGGGGEPPS
jgi:glutathione peroxidase